jgi:neurotransmitter:Na+ symporter, NSS family
MTAPPRETFASRLGTMLTVVGVALGLGNVWRFPYMVGQFGGAAFVLFYVLVSVAIGVPALMAEFALGRHTRRGPVGAFERGGLPFGRQVGWFFFAMVAGSMGYYTAVVGWVLWYAVGEAVSIVRPGFDASAILPPASGFAPTSFFLQLACTAAVLAAGALVVHRGLRAGIERASTIIVPLLLVLIAVLTVRSLTLPGAMAGVEWYVLKLRFADLNANVMAAALGQVIFSLSLGGTFMVVYGSYLDTREPLARPALWTVAGDTGSSLVAGLAVIPAVFALGLTPTAGPGLVFSTLPQVFDALPGGALFGLLFFAGLFGAGYLSDVAAFEVLVAGLTDNTRLTRGRAVVVVAVAVLLLSIPPTLNDWMFVRWDLAFGSGMQTLGALLAALTVGWCLTRSRALRELAAEEGPPVPAWLYYWIRYGIPLGILAAGAWWALSDLLGVARAD